MTDERMAPDAAERDALRRELAGKDNDTLRADDIEFVTRGLDPLEKAAAIAVLISQREAETDRVRAVERRDREPWARSQRVPEGIGDLLKG